MGLCCKCGYGRVDVNEAVCTDCKAIIKEKIRLLKNKPPIGVEPKKIWIRQRMDNLSAAIKRYIKEDRAVPVEWISEYNNIVEEIKTTPKTDIDKWREIVVEYTIERLINKTKYTDFSNSSEVLHLMMDIENVVGKRKSQEFLMFLRIYCKS